MHLCSIITSLFLTLAIRPVQLLDQRNQIHTFSHFQVYFPRRYSTVQEYAKRAQIFNHRVASIRADNSDETLTFKQSVNHLSDLTFAEFLKTHTGLIVPNHFYRMAPRRKTWRLGKRQIERRGQTLRKRTVSTRSATLRSTKSTSRRAATSTPSRSTTTTSSSGPTSTTSRSTTTTSRATTSVTESATTSVSTLSTLPTSTLPYRPLAQQAVTTELPPNPPAVDWVAKGVVSPIQNQGTCGSCWAFSTTASVESQWSILHGKPPIKLSEQQLIDCVPNQAPYGCQGCNGGFPYTAMRWLAAQGGQAMAETYGNYTSSQGQCHGGEVGATLDAPGFVQVSDGLAGSDEALENAIANIGPVTALIFVADDAFQNYQSGVYSNAGCLNGTVNHAVVITGYGHDNSSNNDYWVLRNSWDTTWGIGGYMWMEKSVDLNLNTCFVSQFPAYPTIAISNSAEAQNY